MSHKKLSAHGQSKKLFQKLLKLSPPNQLKSHQPSPSSQLKLSTPPLSLSKSHQHSALSPLKSHQPSPSSHSKPSQSKLLPRRLSTPLLSQSKLHQLSALNQSKPHQSKLLPRKLFTPLLSQSKLSTPLKDQLSKSSLLLKKHQSKLHQLSALNP